MDKDELTDELKTLIDEWWGLQSAAENGDPASAVNRLVHLRRLGARGRAAYHHYTEKAGDAADQELLSRIPLPFVPWEPSYLAAM